VLRVYSLNLVHTFSPYSVEANRARRSQGVLGETLARRRSLLSLGGEVPDAAAALPTTAAGSAVAYEVAGYFGAGVQSGGSRAMRAGSA
jgi:hypothetical protein